MHHTGGHGWQITVGTSATMLIALYLRDTAGLDGAGTPAISSAHPEVRPADPRQLTASVGGTYALREQWEQWWEPLARGHPRAIEVVTPPHFPEFNHAPALQRLLSAHYGAALSWARARKHEYHVLESERAAGDANDLLGDLVEERQLELGREAREFSLQMIELPLSQPRAWWIEPDRLIMSQRLSQHEELLRSYVEPVLEVLV